MRYIDADNIKYTSAVESGFYRNENHRVSGEFTISMFTSKDQIDAVPTADVEPVKHAHWIIDEDNGIVKCSNPDCLAEFSDNGECIEHYWCYCPHCGAKMDEEENEQ